MKKFISLITAVVECLFFTGILFGWSSIRFVLEKEGYYSSLCESEQTDFNINSSISTEESFNKVENVNFTTGIYSTRFPSFNKTSLEYFTTSLPFVGSDSTKVSPEVELVDQSSYPTCKEQSESLNLVFTIASTLLSFSTLVNGYIYDRFGTWVSRVIAICLFTIGCILMAISTIETSWVLYPSLSCFAVGGILMMVTNLQLGNLFGRMRSSVITMLSGALDSSSFVFLLFKIIYDQGVELATIFHVAAWCTILLWIRTFILLPRHHIPFPVPKDFEYGIADCVARKKNNKDNELKIIVKDEETVNFTEEEKLNIPPETPVAPFKTCLRKLIFWTNMAHFSILQLRNYYFLNTLIDWLGPMTDGDGETLSSYLVVFGTCQLFGVLFAPLNGLLMDFSSRLLMKKALVKDLVPLKSTVFSSTATCVLGIWFSIVVATPSLPIQYMSFILQVVFRSFLYGGNMSFIAIAFPGQHFGKLYGTTMTIGGAIALLQYPLFTLVSRQLGGSFLIINIIFIFVSALTLLHPLMVYIHCKKETRRLRSFTDEKST